MRIMPFLQILMILMIFLMVLLLLIIYNQNLSVLVMANTRERTGLSHVQQMAITASKTRQHKALMRIINRNMEAHNRVED